MFRILHRIYVVGWLTLIIGAMVWVYPRTGISEPLADWYCVWQNTQGVPSKPVETITGTVMKVTGPTSFALRGPSQQWYSIGLLGVVPKAAGKAKEAREDSGKARAELSRLILSNTVEVTVVSMDAAHRGLGIVHVGSTNINAVMVETGLLELKQEFIKGMPVREQYALFKAERKGRSHGGSGDEIRALE
jgi:endonuclease YncB( thermonuclease family)